MTKTRSFDVFSPVAPDARRALRTAYRCFLEARDGTPDFEKRTLSLRERAMPHYERPLSRLRQVDRPLFLEQYRAFDPKRPMQREALLLMTLVKINSAEAYAVYRVFDGVQRRALRASDDIELLLLIEEFYHTRILLSSAGLYGIELLAPWRPMQLLRALIGGIAFAPEALSRPLLLIGEVLSAVTFLNLLYATREILAHDPELRDAIEQRVTEILIDELGHLSFNRLLLGAAGMARTKLLLPLVVQSMANIMPELRALGLSSWAEDATTISTSPRLPAAVRSAAFVA